MSSPNVRVLVMYNLPAEDASADEADVLRQRDAVLEALRSLGYEPLLCGCTLDLSRLWEAVREWRPAAAFNLVESLGGSDRLSTLAALLLEALGVPYTGSPAQALLATASKIDMKARLRKEGLPTPDWVVPSEAPSESEGSSRSGAPGAFIVKPVWEHASVGIDDSSLITGLDLAAVRTAIQDRSSSLGRPLFAEEFIDGRELNVSLLEAAEGPRVLPPAEIEFRSFPPGKPRIVGFRAKWDDASFECVHTPRRFGHPPEDGALLDRLRDLALRCWEVFGLRGYARVDFRVDAGGDPWVLEVNSNPCLSPDAGFAAALQEAGISYELGIGSIVDAVLRENRGAGPGQGRRP